jgi:hypothetical protein
MSTYRLRNLFSPRSVALVGTSPRQRSVGRAILGTIHKAKFKGEFGQSALRGNRRPCHGRSSRQIAVCARTCGNYGAPATAVADIVDEAGKRGAAGELIITAGLGHGAGSLAEAAERRAKIGNAADRTKLSWRHDARCRPQCKFLRAHELRYRSRSATCSRYRTDGPPASNRRQAFPDCDRLRAGGCRRGLSTETGKSSHRACSRIARNSTKSSRRQPSPPSTTLSVESRWK